MILNEEYYLTLWGKFEGSKTLGNFKSNTSFLTTKIILDCYRKSKPIHINFQNSKDNLFEIVNHLFIELANDIFCNYADFPKLIPNKTVLRDRRKYADGKKHNYLFKGMQGEYYSLFDVKRGLQAKIKYDDLIKKFIPIERGVQSKTINNFVNFFKKLNDGTVHEFTPTYFEQKSVFIAKKTLWDKLSEKHKIPTAYLPNPREENHLSENKTIPALSDCLVYFTTKYEICYQSLLLEGEKIKTIVVCDTELDKIEQMIQDKARFGFNLIILSDSFSPVKSPAIPCWNWFKEELEIVNAL